MSSHEWALTAETQQGAVRLVHTLLAVADGVTSAEPAGERKREPHGNGCRGGHTTGVFECPVGGNDLISTGLLQEAVSRVGFQTQQGARFKASSLRGTYQSYLSLNSTLRLV